MYDKAGKGLADNITQNTRMKDLGLNTKYLAKTVKTFK